MAELQTCGNCGRIIGKLEQRSWWEGHVVCPACAQVLNDNALLEAAQRSLNRRPDQNSKGSRSLVLLACFGAVAVSIAAAVATYLHYSQLSVQQPAAAAAPAAQPAPTAAPKTPMADAISPAVAPRTPAPAVTTLEEPVQLFDEVAPARAPSKHVEPEPSIPAQAPRPMAPRQPTVAKTTIQPAEFVEPKVVDAPAKPDPKTSPTTQPARELTGIAGQIEKGKQLLASGLFKEAAAAFRNALDFDKNSALAMHGLALAQYQLGDKPRAIALMEKAVPASDNANRAIVYNLAVMHLRGDNPMRAAKYVRDYLARVNAPLDEPLQNVLGVALAGANESTRAGPVFPKLRDFYFQYDAKLATARANGTARWGMRWIPTGQAELKWAASKARAEAYAKAQYDANHAALGTKKAQQAVYDLNHSFGLHSERERVAASRNLQSAARNEAEVRKQLDRERKNLSSTDMPEFPKSLDFIPIDALRPEQNPPQS
jgi:hypothetical protein